MWPALAQQLVEDLGEGLLEALDFLSKSHQVSMAYLSAEGTNVAQFEASSPNVVAPNAWRDGPGVGLSGSMLGWILFAEPRPLSRRDALAAKPAAQQ